MDNRDKTNSKLKKSEYLFIELFFALLPGFFIGTALAVFQADQEFLKFVAAFSFCFSILRLYGILTVVCFAKAKTTKEVWWISLLITIGCFSPLAFIFGLLLLDLAGGIFVLGTVGFIIVGIYLFTAIGWHQLK